MKILEILLQTKSAVEDLKTSIGERLLPVATESVSIFGGLVTKLTEFIAERKRLKEAEEAEIKTTQDLIVLQEYAKQIKITKEV